MRIKFVDLQRQNKIIKKEIMTTLEKVVDQADFNMGPRLEKYEQDFASYCSKKYAIGVNSGTDALLLSLMAYDIGPGDEVLVPANSYFSSAMVISNIGAIPVFVDIDPSSFTIDIEKIKKKITSKTKAIMPVHLYGQPADMKSIIDIAKKHSLVIIEDACQAHGSMYDKKMIPFSETGAFSFYPGKNLGCFGDGGAVVTDSARIAQRILHLRNDGSYKKYVHLMFGIKSRLDTIQAAVLNVKLPYLSQWNNLRRKNANLYTTLLSDIPEIKTPSLQVNSFHVFHLYVIEYSKRNKLQQYLTEKGIETLIHYPIPIHLQKPYKKLGYKEGDFPVTEMKSKVILSLPMFPELRDNEIKYICDEIKTFVINNRT